MLKYLLLIVLPTVEVTGGSSPRFADTHNIFSEAKRVNKQAKMIVGGLYIKIHIKNKAPKKLGGRVVLAILIYEA